MPWFNRRRSGAIILIVAGILGVYIGLLLHGIQPLASSPKPGGGGNGGGGNNGNSGNGGNGGGNGSGGGTSDTQPPVTVISIVGRGYMFVRSGVQFYSGNFTVALNATDDEAVDRVYLRDNESSVTLASPQVSASGRSIQISITITVRGTHMLSYYSVDKAGNSETPQNASVGIGKPSLSDLSNLISNSGVDNAGIKNALLAKVNAAEGQQASGQPMNSLNALVNQLNALDGKHGLDNSTVANIEAMITAIITA